MDERVAPGKKGLSGSGKPNGAEGNGIGAKAQKKGNKWHGADGTGIRGAKSYGG